MDSCLRRNGTFVRLPTLQKGTKYAVRKDCFRDGKIGEGRSDLFGCATVIL